MGQVLIEFKFKAGIDTHWIEDVVAYWFSTSKRKRKPNRYRIQEFAPIPTTLYISYDWDDDKLVAGLAFGKSIEEELTPLFQSTIIGRAQISCEG